MWSVNICICEISENTIFVCNCVLIDPQILSPLDKGQVIISSIDFNRQESSEYT